MMLLFVLAMLMFINHDCLSAAKSPRLGMHVLLSRSTRTDADLGFQINEKKERFYMPTKSAIEFSPLPLRYSSSYDIVRGCSQKGDIFHTEKLGLKNKH